MGLFQLVVLSMSHNKTLIQEGKGQLLSKSVQLSGIQPLMRHQVKVANQRRRVHESLISNWAQLIHVQPQELFMDWIRDYRNSHQEGRGLR